MRLYRSCAVAVVVLALAARLVWADGATSVPPGQLKFRVFAGTDGLHNLVVKSIAQDAEGLLWLATEDGAYRFDGERFARFAVDDGLPSSATTVVAMSPHGEVCMGTFLGLACWTGTRFSRDAARGLPSVPIQRLVAFAGKLWVGTSSAGLYVQDASGGFIPAPGWPADATSVRALWEDTEGLVAGTGASVALSTGDGTWRDIGDVGLAHERVDGVLRDRDGALWIRTQRHLWQLPRGATRAIDQQDGVPTGYDIPTGATAMVIGPRGDVLVGTDDGMAMREGDHWRLVNRASGMPASPIRTLFVDREGSVWIGSAGLFQLRGRGVVEYDNVASGLPGDVVWSYRRDRQGALWVGTNRCLAHVVDGKWRCLAGTEGRMIRSFAFPPQGGVFVGGAPSDLLYIDATGHPVPLGEFALVAPPNVLALELSPSGDLWVATSVGLYRLPGAVPGTLERIQLPGVPVNARIASLLWADGRLWTTAAPGGIAVLDGGAWQLFGTTAGFRSSAFNYVVRRADGRLCAAYAEAIGLTCFRYDAGAVSQLEHIGTPQGLNSGRVYFLGEDRERRLWVGTGDGVDVVTAQGVDHFEDSDGLAGNDTAANAFLLDSDGSVWLGSTGGATHVLAQHYTGPPSPPRTIVLSGRLGEIPFGGAVAPGELRAPHDHGALAVDLAAGTLLDARRVEYEMRMSPLEPEWTPTHEHQLHYPAMQPGAYRFEVRARIGAGAWGPTTTLGFTILPAWWQTGWFTALVAIGGLALIGLGFTWRQRVFLLRRTRQLNEQTDASFLAVIDLMPDLTAVLRDQVLIYCNAALRRFLGIEPPKRWGELSVYDWIHPDDHAQVYELFAKVRGLEHPVSEVVEFRMRAADGSWRTCEVSGVRVEIGNATTVVASGRDVTDRKRMRAKLLVSDRMASLGTLAAGIAHEINNPLAYVTGNLEAMAETLQSSDPALERKELSQSVAEARDGVERVRKIVQGLRSFTRSEDAPLAPLALNGVIEAAIRLTGNEVRHRAQLFRELGPAPMVAADDGRLTQVFINLLINAAHAIPEGRSDANRIIVRTWTDDGGRAVIEVEDTGKGVAPEVAARVFEPFFTTKDVGEGTGLGLSICHGIVVGMGGVISIESPVVRDGVISPGTLVRVVLPAASPPMPAASEPLPVIAPAAAVQRHRVMLVDDEPMVVHTMERLLRRDYDITVALCGQDAIDHIAKGARFDAIVSDVMMPNMTGIELMEQLQQLAPDQSMRMIFLSGGAFTAEARERLQQLGAPQLEKPVTAKELRACVMKVAEAAAAAAAGTSESSG